MTMEAYTTITGEIPAGGVSPVLYEIQRSRFLAYAIHAEDEEEVRAWLADVKKEHYEARHVPYAMVLGARADRQRSSDDGEPGGTAGSPILEAITARGITYAAVAVVRYFGGIKLGAGGLIRAYAHAAGLGLEAAAKLRMTPLHTMYVQLDYDLLAAAERYVRDAALQTDETNYADAVTLALLVPTGDIELHQRALTDLTAGRARYQLGDQKYSAVPIP
ncbi:YigZ family protein [Selenomonas sp. FOBRC6]|uniref:IMPACT family protein n=1 Tax=Selenomonas sp. FOBRC6 TaxID=936572 RepID=UPI0002781DBD|nr:YigZ family protein [Selenomonas sp. FOBRC6]EJO23712.1 YigZ family protein [Selenomonas sp. FOBRC6]